MAQSQTSDGTGFKQDIHTMGQGVDALRADVANIGRAAADAARSGVAELRDGARHAVDVAKDKFDGARESAAETTESVKGVISRNPLASVAIAAGVGLLVGCLLGRSRS